MNPIPTHKRPALAGMLLACLTTTTAGAAAENDVPQVMQVPADNRIVWQAPAGRRRHV